VPALELERVRKAFDGAVAVDWLSLAIAEGQIFGLLGPNGAGKTTTIRMMVGIIAPDSGDIRIFGQPFNRRHLRRVGYLPEERGLYRRARVREILAFLAGLNGIDRAAARKAIGHWAERLDIAAWLDRRVEELSKGMQQKIQLIATLLHDPDFIIMDEPFSGLDPVNTALLMDIIFELKRAGRTILFSSHRMDHVEKLCDEICLIDHGGAVLAGRIGEIKARFGARNVRIVYDRDGGGPILDDNPLIEARADYGNCAELRLAPLADAQEVLHAAAAHARISRFEVMEPSLEEIFIATVGSRNGR
jgi:ABC-2 type transport system ATP-binding protein